MLGATRVGLRSALPLAVLLTWGCSGDSADPVITYVPNGQPAGCSANIDVCANETPRVEVTVTDESGKPVQYAMVNSYYPSFSLTNVDSVEYPDKDGFGRKKSYYTCTNEQGKASLCGWPNQDTGTGRDIDVWRTGYRPSSSRFDSTAPALAPGVVRTLDVTLTKAAEVGQTSKVLFVPCFTGDEHRLPFLLTYENVAFTIPAFGQVVDALMADPAHPLANFDTLVLDTGCSWNEPYEEFLVPAKNAKLWDWIAAGGRVLMSEPSYTGWSTADTVNCPAAPCSDAFFPAPYRFDFVPKTLGSARNCARFLHGTIADAASPFVQGLTFDNWSYVEYRQSSWSDAKLYLTWGATKKSTVDTSLWHPILTVSSSAQEVADKAACWENNPSLNTTDAAVAMMKTDYDAGTVILNHAAWVQGSNGERVGGGEPFDANAVILKNNIVRFILGK